ncbi:MAG: phosphoribosylglycinamide formyltransferase [Gemmatimonadetes bacterium]|uniref:Phosphoribosylglycinamide formyltransferase n=1 Tax=Candidatus Kutchimonas denitrificans TaxID=3056748 RepID=A0AAE4ZAP0_9BACT|nr:phosphoribosylglycinamide formyltransferase [Gemmatimonadota bacterium]NIR76168.1 phosphoribosylglycinamide formyltransferase [Candidatus Kutchimonas denitrificans]NIS00608.1 phosphoribosylglycinamide formyltransferase [Gemmatimonadota bacterium]NIT66753.1 phosphoribosylglycinamide formyltransferase [Gemmatimonadota bacterium]NIV23352.1 phosphoribosylglycinamide formyltransferase [Gemmatimonadota bacterium]
MAEIPAVAVFASGGGTNLQALLDTFGADGRPDPSCRIALVVSDRPGVGALDRAERAGVPDAIVRPKDYEDADAFGRALLEVLREHGIELIALAGYLKLVPESVVGAYRGRIVNIHPGPLPAFGGSGMWGHHVHEAVIASNAQVSGPTVHFVDERYDTGPIIAQWPVPVFSDDTPDSLAARVLKYEHRLYPSVLSALARGDITLDDDGRVRRGAGLESLGFQLTAEDDALASSERGWQR